VGRKQGSSVYYSVVDPLIFDLLDVARKIFNNHLVVLQAAAGIADDEASGLASGAEPVESGAGA
jgi:ArsR family transcriptional regulator